MPQDLYGLPLTASKEAADHFNVAMTRLLRIQDGVEAGLAEAVSADPEFVHAHAALALLGNEWCLPGLGRDALARAHATAAGRTLHPREKSFLAAVDTRLNADCVKGAQALLDHIAAFPLDAFTVGIAVPSIAFGGLTAGSHTARFIESLMPAYGDDPWFASQLGFIRQEQGRFEEAAVLIDHALAADPAFGHGAHARAHIHYELGEHTQGVAWLDDWIKQHGSATNHRSHFCWHAALHELMQGDTDAFHRRYAHDLAPPSVSGCRVLVDAGALVWRGRVTCAWDTEPCVDEIIRSAPAQWFETPPSAFAAMHAALSLAAANNAEGLEKLQRHAAKHCDPLFVDAIAPLAEGLAAAVRGDWVLVAPKLEASLKHIEGAGASKAQNDVIEDTIVHALALSGSTQAAVDLLQSRLDRRASPLDRNRLEQLLHA